MLNTANTIATIDNTNPTVANVRFERERRPKTDMTMPTIGTGKPQKGIKDIQMLMIPSTRPAMAKPARRSVVGTAPGTP